MADDKKPAKDMPISDVAEPGKSAPSPNSKSIILNNRPIVKDPMVNAENPKPETGNEHASGEPTTTPAAAKSQLQPSSEPTIKPAASDTDTPNDETKTPDTPEQPVKASPEPAKTEPTKTDDPAAAEASESEAKDPAAEAEAEASKQAEHDETIQKLADSKQYYLPINSVEKRRSRRLVILGILLSLVLIIAWADVALDAGLVQLAGAPHTHLFDRQSMSSPAPAAPVVTYKSFTTTVSKLTFRYPSSWRLNNNGLAQSDLVDIEPASGNVLVTTGTVSVTFASPPIASSSPSLYTVKAVHYQKLAHQISGSVYLRDLVVQNKNGNILLVSGLTNSNSIVVGATISTLEDSFLNGDGTTSSSFTINGLKSSSPGSFGFASVADAQNFIHNANYQKARAVLLSTAVAKTPPTKPQ